MKTQLTLLAGALMLITGVVHAGEFEDYAKVVRVTPRTEQVNVPRSECWEEYETHHESSRGYGGAVVGGVAGGILGNQVGKGHGRTAATAIGAITGAIVGDRVQNRDGDERVVRRPVEHCRKVDHWETRTNGYEVTYQYRGNTYTDWFDHDPGRRVAVRVSVTPVQ